MKKIGLGVLVFVFVISLVLSGCSKNENQPNNTDDATSTPAAETAAPTEEAPAVPEKYDPPIEITTVRESVLSYVKLPEGDDMDNNVWTRAYLDNYGIKLKSMWIAEGYDQFLQKSNLTIVSGDLPDYMQVSPAQFKQLNEAGLIEDLTEVYNKYASESVKRVLAEGGSKAMQSATIDGKLMAIPWTANPKEIAPVLWVRTDWLEKLKLPEPKTMQDVLAISEAFTKQDPDGNGANDTFGLAAEKALSTLPGFYNGFHAYSNIWIKDASGQLVFSNIQPEMKAALQKLQEMYIRYEQPRAI